MKYQWSDWLYLLRLELYAFFSTACRHRAIYLVQDPAEVILLWNYFRKGLIDVVPTGGFIKIILPRILPLRVMFEAY